MSYQVENSGHARAGTFGGTILSIATSIELGDVTKSIVLATIGATVSFLVSLGLKALQRKLRDKKVP